MWHKHTFIIIFSIILRGLDSEKRSVSDINLSEDCQSESAPTPESQKPKDEITEALRLNGGVLAVEGQFKYAVSLQYDKESVCGGSIIKYEFVVTAAHCVVDLENGEFRSQRPRILTDATNIYHQGMSNKVIEVIKVYIPKEFNPQAFFTSDDRAIGDIAVLKLETSSNRKPTINLTLAEDPNESYTGAIATVVGFGRDTDVRTFIDRTTNETHESGQSSGSLRYADATVISNKNCSQLMRKIRDSNICAQVKQGDKGLEKGVCSGDSGGPLVYNETLIGVLSTSPFGCQEDIGSGVYTRVSSYIKFIKSAMADKVSENIRVKDYSTIND